MGRVLKMSNFSDCFGDLDPSEQLRLKHILNRINDKIGLPRIEEKINFNERGYKNGKY